MVIPLTNPAGTEVGHQQNQTHSGQAHWAYTGPEGKTCRECRSWSCSPIYRRDEFGALKPRQCRKYRGLMGGVSGKGIPHDAISCKYFVAAGKPAAIEGRNTPKAVEP